MMYVLDFVKSFIWILCRIAPWMLLGFLVSGVMSLFFTAARIKKHLGGTGFWPIFKAVMIGIPLPLCSCGVVPVATALRKEGASKGATAAFYVATPQIGVNSTILTFSVMGWVIGIIRVVVAFVTGMISGLLVGRLADETSRDKKEEHSCCCHKEKEEAKEEAKEEHSCCCCHKEETEKEAKEEHGCCCHKEDEKEAKHSCCCHKEEAGQGVIYRIFNYGFNTMVVSIAPSLLTGLLVAAVIQLLVPNDFGASYFGGHTALEFLALIIIAIPMYVCSSGAVPIAVSLVLKGFSPGAALVFMLAGPASNAAMLTTMSKLLGIKATMIYITTLAFVAILAGTLLNLSGYMIEGVAIAENGISCISIEQQMCGALLAALMMRAFIVRYLFKQKG